VIAAPRAARVREDQNPLVVIHKLLSCPLRTLFRQAFCPFFRPSAWLRRRQASSPLCVVVANGRGLSQSGSGEPRKAR
jgi:hypothetical protein